MILRTSTTTRRLYVAHSDALILLEGHIDHEGSQTDIESVGLDIYPVGVAHLNQCQFIAISERCQPGECALLQCRQDPLIGNRFHLGIRHIGEEKTNGDALMVVAKSVVYCSRLNELRKGAREVGIVQLDVQAVAIIVVEPTIADDRFYARFDFVYDTLHFFLNC